MDNYRVKQLIDKVQKMEVNNMSKEEAQKSFTKDELDILKVAVAKIQKSEEDEFEKGGKKGILGEIREHNGKKFKKVGEGKWLEVSEHGMSKKEHLEEKRKAKISSETAFREARRKDLDKYDSEQDKHHYSASKLSDKDHSDEEVGVKGEKKNEGLSEQAKSERKTKLSVAEDKEERNTIKKEYKEEKNDNSSEKRVLSELGEKLSKLSDEDKQWDIVDHYKEKYPDINFKKIIERYI